MTEARRRHHVVDDFGLSSSGDLAALELARAGAVQGVSVMVGAASPGAIAQLAATGVELGLHLDLTSGRPSCPAEQIPSLLDSHGKLLPLPRLAARLLRGAARRDHLEREVEAQLGLLAAQVAPAHLDGHQHVHFLPGVFEATCAVLARRGGPPLRVRLPRFPAGLSVPRRLGLGAAVRWHQLKRRFQAGGWPFTFMDRTLDYGYPGSLNLVGSAEVMMHVAHPQHPEPGLDHGSYPFAARAAQFTRRLAEHQDGDAAQRR